MGEVGLDLTRCKPQQTTAGKVLAVGYGLAERAITKQGENESSCRERARQCDLDSREETQHSREHADNTY